MTPAVLAVSDLKIALDAGHPVVEDISFELGEGQALGLVGESGSGKTTAALALLGFTRPGMRVVHGHLQVAGETVDLTDERAARRLRGRLISHVPQDPPSSLNPSLRIERIIADVAERGSHFGHENPVLASLDRVHLPGTREFARRFPHQLSGG